MKIGAIEEIEINLLREAIFQRYGYDFRQYAHASFKRRIKQAMASLGIPTISVLTARIMHDEPFFQEVVARISVVVTEMFRDPLFYQVLRQRVIPYLKTYPFIKAWVAGCATGEEAYSLAILFQEEGISKRTTIFATDMNEAALEAARDGIYPLDRIKGYTANYQKAGGLASFSDYYHARYGSALLDQGLKRTITFARHNLALDNVFSEMHLILCRNVLIYFQPSLQQRACGLFHDSLVHDGFLGLGLQEVIREADGVSRFATFDRKFKIYRRLREVR